MTERIKSLKDHNGHTVELPTQHDIEYAKALNECRSKYYQNNTLKQLMTNKVLVNKANKTVRALRKAHQVLGLSGEDGGIPWDTIGKMVPLKRDSFGFYHIPVRVDYEKGLVIYSEKSYSGPSELQTPEGELRFDSEDVDALVGDHDYEY